MSCSDGGGVHIATGDAPSASGQPIMAKPRVRIVKDDDDEPTDSVLDEAVNEAVAMLRLQPGPVELYEVRFAISIFRRNCQCLVSKCRMVTMQVVQHLSASAREHKVLPELLDVDMLGRIRASLNKSLGK